MLIRYLKVRAKKNFYSACKNKKKKKYIFFKDLNFRAKNTIQIEL